MDWRTRHEVRSIRQKTEIFYQKGASDELDIGESSSDYSGGTVVILMRWCQTLIREIPMGREEIV
jgi:hypothetical protein